MTKQELFKLLESVGAGFAVRTDKYCCTDHNCCGDGRKVYHVHPDKSQPYQSAIMCFYSLMEIERWCKAMQKAQANPADAEIIMQDYYDSYIY